MSSVTYTILSKKIKPADIVRTTRRYGLRVSLQTREVFADDQASMDLWIKTYAESDITFTYVNGGIKPNCYLNRTINNYSLDALKPRATGRSWFTATEIANIYRIPLPTQSTKVVVGVVSLGGGLYGNIDANGVLTGGDIQAYWSYIGIPTENHPKILVKFINGASNNTADKFSTVENTLDIETLGGCCPSSNLTIILYVSPNSVQAIFNCFNYILNTPVISGGVSYKPTIISCSWGLPEVYLTTSFLTTFNNLLATASAKGINICTASGDDGSNNGVGGKTANVDFPSSCPNVISVGGTNLVCPNNIYDNLTSEKAWTSGGGAVSKVFPKPSYQNTITATGRSVPDIALIADPSTGIMFLINGNYQVYGGTSVAAPVCAGFFAAINANKFANPVFYNSPSSFNDILTGSNGAFSANSGYDNCTGLGSLKGDVLSQLLSTPSIPAVLASGVVLNPVTLSLNIGQTAVITPTLNPANASNKNISWSSSNTAIATVTSGVVTSVSSGTAIITARTTDGSNKSATCTLTVNKPVESVSLGLSLAINGTISLLANIQPASSTNKSVTWSSSNTNTATVADGVLTGRAVGSSTITATTIEGAKTSTILVTVR